MQIKDIIKISYNKMVLYKSGVVVTLLITFMEVLRGRHLNFLVFADSSLDFWNGISPYTADFINSHGRFFLYTPIFSVLFTPFAALPSWLGPFVWNLFNFTLFFWAVFSLPAHFGHRQKCHMFLFLFPILAQSLFSFQYNVPVAYIFLLSYSLLERNRGGMAVLLILISGLTKIYGIFALTLLPCYPHFWRNVGYAIVWGLLLMMLPLLELPLSGLLPYYQEWLQALSVHQSVQVYDSLFYAQPLSHLMLPYFRAMQMGVLGLLAICFLCVRKKWHIAAFRAQALGILMGWVVLFSDSAERHTYIIALAGFALWFWSRVELSRTDKLLFWLNFILLGLIPIDLICPVLFRLFVTRVIWLHVWVFFYTWLRMVWLTFFRPVAEYATDDGCSNISTIASCIESGGRFDIVCPCYNPAPDFIAKLSRPLAELRARYSEKDFHLIVVNDGSTRNFGPREHELLLEQIPNAEIVDIPHGGKGAATRAGLSQSKAPYAIYTDIDMPYTLESMCSVVNLLIAGNDVVIAVRNSSYHSKLPFMRKLMSHGSRMLNRVILNTRYTDTQGGLKGLSPAAREVMKDTRIRDFLFDTEFIMRAERESQLRIVEMESSLREDVFMSKMSTRVMFRELKNFFRIVFRLC